ncbi:MAG: glycogen phosphorylase, partial [Clostridiales bacterium]|nr:glycogen phosphorylase [Clostridiales bacterium]
MSNMNSNKEKTAERIVSRAADLAMAKYHVSLAGARPYQLHDALSSAVMESISARWAADQDRQWQGRFCAYVSAEFLTGRAVYNNLYSAGILEQTKALLAEKGADIACLEDIEDAALGNGGLGRLAACFLDSAATCDIPLTGYGLRYQYGLFKQEFVDCRQHEIPDDWTKYGDPWSIRREEFSVIVPMKGLAVKAVPYDMPVIGCGQGSCI